MKKSDFAKQYKRLDALYGVKTEDHFEEWFLQFGKLSAEDFEQQVTEVISKFRLFGQVRWPTPGDFNFIVGGNVDAAPLDVDYPDTGPLDMTLMRGAARA